MQIFNGFPMHKSAACTAGVQDLRHLGESTGWQAQDSLIHMAGRRSCARGTRTYPVGNYVKRQFIEYRLFLFETGQADF